MDYVSLWPKPKLILTIMKSFKFLVGLVAVSVFSSCNFTEDMYINNDGTGKFSVAMDASSLMAMAGKEVEKNPEANKVIDSTFSFKTLLATKKDSISKLPKEEQERLKKLENYTMSMKMNAKEGQMLFTMAADFKNVTEIEDAMSSMSNITSTNGIDQSNPLAKAGGLPNNNSKLKYSYNGRKFSRKAILLPKKDVENDSLGEAYNMIYESSTYTVKYHFPKKIKKVSAAGAVISDDKKSVTIEFPFMDYMKEPEKLNFEVEFE